jgi:hypothetical protein
LDSPTRCQASAAKANGASGQFEAHAEPKQSKTDVAVEITLNFGSIIASLLFADC